MGDQAYEAQACYSLGNTYTLMKDFPKAIDFHSRHLRAAIQLHDRSVGATAVISSDSALDFIVNGGKKIFFARFQ